MPPDAVRQALDRWRQMVAEGDLSALPALLHPAATFRSPMVFKPYQSAQAVALVLTAAAQVFEDFAYERELTSADGLSVVLEFRARVGDRSLKGIDLIRFDAEGRIVDFEVMIRPLNGLQALGAEMARRVGALLPAYRAPGAPAGASE